MVKNTRFFYTHLMIEGVPNFFFTGMRVALLFGLTTLFSLIFAEAPVVETNYGPVKGFTYESEKGHKANVFLGIPFAKSPIGDLRFEVSIRPSMDGLQAYFCTSTFAFLSFRN